MLMETNEVRLRRSFFDRSSEMVAPELLGKYLIRKKGDHLQVGKIVETEAYLGFGDRASHSYKGMTKRNEPMFGPSGFSYVYFTYGMHWLLNIVTEKEGSPSGVLIRAIEPLLDTKMDLPALNKSELRRLGSGPARLTKWLEITGEENRTDIINSEYLYVVTSFATEGQIFKEKPTKSELIKKAPRVGVGFAGEQANDLLRFYFEDSPFVS